MPPHKKSSGLIRLVDGQRRVCEAPEQWASANDGWSSAPQEADGPQWVNVDLAELHKVSEVRLYPRDDAGNEGVGFPMDFNVQVSPDGKAWKTVAAREGVPCGKEVQVVNFEPAEARHVRLVGTKLRQNPADKLYRMQIVELEVNGPVEPARQ